MTINPENTSNSRFAVLDALRGVAALMVVYFHFTTLAGISTSIRFNLGAMGVDLFFMISGFVIFMSLSKVSSGLEFIINRLSRLYPTYWSCVSYTFFILAMYSLYHHQKIDWISYLGNMTMFQKYLGINDLDLSYWTMIIEMNFYFFMLILSYAKLLNYIREVTVVICALLLLAAPFAQESAILTGISSFSFFSFAPLFFSGIIFYKICTEQKKLYLNYFIIFLCLIVQIILRWFEIERTRHFIDFNQYVGVLLFLFVVFILFVNKRLEFSVNKITLFLGKISYAWYLSHQTIALAFILPLLINRFQMSFWAACLLIALPYTIFVATLITFYLEKPLSAKMKTTLKQVFKLQQ